jgi:ubiquinone/menaquinone biosynthesis C-methylase UbiE
MSLSSGVRQVATYYDTTSAIYLKYIGRTCQAGLILGHDPDPYRSTVIYTVKEAKIKEGDRILDAGSGFSGPAIDICTLHPTVSVHCITISNRQGEIARELVQAAGFSDRIKVIVGDFHSLPFPDQYFDVILFLESSGHSDTPRRLFLECARVLKKNSTLYIKDIFCSDSRISEEQKEDIQEFNRLFSYKILSISQIVAYLTPNGFTTIECKDLAPFVSTSLFNAALWADGQNRRMLSEFGQAHLPRRPFRDLPLAFWQIFSTKA